MCAGRLGALCAALSNPAVRNAEAVSAATSATIDVIRCRRLSVHCMFLTSSRLLRRASEGRQTFGSGAAKRALTLGR